MRCIREIGDTCVGAKINGRLVPLRTQLGNGDQVEIVTSKAQHAVADLGAVRRHRQGARPHPPLHPHPAARPVSRSRQGDRAKGLPPGGPRVFRTAARSGAEDLQLPGRRGSLCRGRRRDWPPGARWSTPPFRSSRRPGPRSSRWRARAARSDTTTPRCRSAASSPAWRCTLPAAATRCPATASSASSPPARG